MIRFVALPTEIAHAYRRGAPDANGQTPERRIAETSGLPCRHCLADVTEGEEGAHRRRSMTVTGSRAQT